MSAPLPFNEATRLEALRQYEVLDTPPEAEFDDLTFLAAQICNTPISTLTLIDQHRQWFKSRVGLKMSEAPRDVSICAHAILEPDILLVPDLEADPRFADNPLVTGEAHLRFYAGVPLVTPEGQSVGTLCVIDTKPRQLDSKQRESLHRLAHQAVALLEARPNKSADNATEKRQSRQQRRQAEQERRAVAAEITARDEDSLTASEVRYRRLFESAQDGILILDAASGQIEDVNPYLCQLLGYAPEDFLGKQLWEIGTFRDIAASKDAFRALQQKEYNRHDDLPLQTRDGQKVSVEFVSNVYQSGAKKVIQCNIRNITARKQSQAQLHFQKTLLEAQMETSLDGILVVSESGRILSYNGHFLQMWNVPADILSDDDVPLRQFITDQLIDRQGFSAKVQHLYDHRDEQSHDELILQDGRIFDRYSAPVTNGGSYYGRVWYFRDISERKQAETSLQRAHDELESRVTRRTAELGKVNQQLHLELAERERTGQALREAQQMLQLVMNHIPQAIFWKDRECVYLGANYRLAADAGFASPDELIGKNDFEMPWAEFATAYQADDRQVMESDAAKLNFEEPLVRADGGFAWLRTNKIPLHDSENQVVGVLCSYEDITEQKQAEVATQQAKQLVDLANAELRIEIAGHQRAVEAQQESYALLHAVTESTTDSIFVKDLDGRYLMINSAGALRRGKPEAQILGKLDTDLFSPATAQMLIESDRRVLATDTTLTFEEITTEDGATRTHLVTKSPHRNPRGEVVGVLGIARDITARAQQQEALRLAKEEADSANLAKSEFLSRMSHELRTPLNAILGFGQIMEQQDLAPRQKESISYILKGGRHLLALINEVLDIARVEAGHIELSLEPVALDDIVPEACALIRPLSAGRNIHLHENTAKMGGAYILADQQRLKQGLINLLSNAIKYNRESGEVEVLCQTEPGGWIAIAVRDTGPGIAPEDLPKLFVPFERLNAGTSDIEGTGLGLVLSQRLITAMGGTITVTSILDQGTTFTLRFPQAASPAEQVTNVPSDLHRVAENRVIISTYSVLCIEDNASNLRLVEAILEDRPEINLMAAMQGSVGLDLARQHHPDLILLDLNLPDMHGLQVLTRLQQSDSTKNIPIVVISADATPNQIERLLTAGAKAYLTKPLNVGQFLATLDEWLRPKPPIVPPSATTQG